MPIAIADLRQKLLGAFPGARVEIEDLTGGSDHFRALIVANEFERKLPIERHRMVFAALGDLMQTDIHALSLVTRTPSET